jgi:dihydrofolate reductase
MRKIIVSEFVSLDGVVEDPGGSEKSKHGGWTWGYWNDEIGKFKLDEILATGALLLGRVTYQGFAAAWPSMKDEQGFADRMNNLPKHVVSTTLERLDWNNSRQIKGNIAEEVSKLKQQPGQDILIFGSGELVRELMQRDLIDEYRLLVYPVVLGGGKHLFGDEINKTLKLVETKPFSSGVVLLRYHRAENVRK